MEETEIVRLFKLNSFTYQTDLKPTDYFHLFPGAIDPKKSPACRMLNREGTDSVDALKSPAVVFLGIDESKVKNAMTSPSLQGNFNAYSNIKLIKFLLISYNVHAIKPYHFFYLIFRTLMN